MAGNDMKLAARERPGENYIPYRRHLDETTVVLEGRGLLSVIELDGMAFQTADTVDINGHHFAWNTLLRNAADDSVMLWSVTLRRRSAQYPDGTFPNAFAQGLDDRYRERMNGAHLFRNRLCL